MTDNSIRLERVTKRFDNAEEDAVSAVDLLIEPGEFLVLVGPSGCGKSTLLRMIAGLEDVSDGSITIAGRNVTYMPARDRDVAMVFQNYALYPHMTVYKNLAYGLRVRRTPKPDVDARVKEVARLLGLDELLERRPSQLSGGQRQRVAMGRAIIRQPAAYLMDEPLSNLDAKLRVTMRTELAAMHARLATTTVYVTHDQVEAMTLGQRVTVMRDGVVQQVSAPQDLYRHPANLFVAGFIGSPAMNFFDVNLIEDRFELASHQIAIARERRPKRGGEIILGVRPPAFEDAEFAETGLPTVTASVVVVEELGDETHLVFSLPTYEGAKTTTPGAHDSILPATGRLFTASVDPRTRAKPGASVVLAIDPTGFHYFDRTTGMNIGS